MTVPAEKIEKENFYNKCNMSKEAWVSYFNKPMTFGKEEQIVNIAGVDLVCGDDTYAVGDLRIKFTNPKAQEYWAANLEGREKYKRERLAEFRKAEQQHHADIRSVSSAFTDPRDGQVYRTIKVEGREWFAQNVNYNVEGHSWCYEEMGEYAGFWSAQNGKNETIWLWSMGRMSDQMVRQLVPNNAKNNAYSVRCINGN